MTVGNIPLGLDFHSLMFIIDKMNLNYSKKSKKLGMPSTRCILLGGTSSNLM